MLQTLAWAGASYIHGFKPLQGQRKTRDAVAGSELENKP